MRIKNVTCALLLLGVSAHAPAAAPPSVNISYTGNLVTDPCTILPGDEEIQLDFGTVIDKYLYLNSRTLGQPFEIRLAECDLELGKTVKVTFTGTENTALPGLLAIDAASEATGIAIGLETLEAKPLWLNKESGDYPLQAGNSRIALKAYVRGEPKAITDKTIGRGPFSAVATFNLEYE
ncbi:Fimbria A protein precursor [Serratia entomophila]|uniref:Type 1 fimbrial protein n=1 Tax=Serratia entomophila TaxID=42906 RepID=A0ABY5CU82_9GAMM|nr:fimbrial protein [Serratia entomophila]UIW18845.1 type 1 fimbrial protein [Serratia entomophila]USV01504.1 type 1 fimbrial protein [Serratia entomophila]CAI0775086.1 Fimbria A protein precursor [Serratia entomophila]CAI0776586.1 Fimbria A protein precursor [Serratia entomophila]CAI0798078.1 Fimbria A protein precursor [Serratia entomophila]